MIRTISLGMPSKSSRVAELSRNPHSSAPKAIPMGLLRPERAIAIPVKPRPAGKSRE